MTRAPERKKTKSALAIFRIQCPEDTDKKSIYRNLLRLIWPAAIEFFLLQLVNMFDQIQVGSLGETALAAVGLATQINLLFVSSFVAVNIGVTALVARAWGGGHREEVPRLLRHGLLLTAVLAAPTAVLGILFADKVLLLMNAPDAVTLRLGTDYLRICLIGFVPVALTSTITAALRGSGNTRTPMFYNLLANAINIFLNWVLINGRLGFPRLEVRGAAIATVIGNSCAFLVACWVAFRPHNVLQVRLRDLVGRINTDYVKRIWAIGFPSMGEQLLVRLGIAVFTATVATLGTTLYAAHSVCINIQALTFMSGMAFSVASTTLTGQSLGANRSDLAKVYSNRCALISLLFSFVLMAIYIFAGPSIIRIYNADPAIVAAGTMPLRIVALMQPFAAIQYVYSGALRGAGDTKSVALITILTMFLCRPLFAYLAIRVFHVGLVGAWVALCLDQTLCSLLIVRRYATEKWCTIVKTVQPAKI